MNTYGLTPRGLDLLRFIIAHQATTGTAPSFDEMRQAVGLASKSGVHRIMQQLVERGYISYLRNRARAIQVLRDPDRYVDASDKLTAMLQRIARESGSTPETVWQRAMSLLDTAHAEGRL